MTQQEFTCIINGANQGKKDSIYQLAKMYYEGTEIQQDKKLAKDWMEKYVEIGGSRYLGEVTYLLGLMYFNGDECEQEQLLAIQYFIASYNEGYTPASTILNKLISGGCIQHLEYVGQQVKLPPFVLCAIGDAYAKGNGGVEQDGKTAISYYNLALTSGFDFTTKANANYGLAKCYESGRGCEPDLQKAYTYYKDAQNQGKYEAINDCGRVKRLIDNFEAEQERLRKEAEAEEERKRAEAEAEAERLRKEAEAEAEAEREREEAEAKRNFLIKAAEDGDTEAMYKYALALLQGSDGFTKDINKGMEIMTKAAEAKNHFAEYKLGMTYKYGYYGQKKNNSKARRFLARAANHHIGYAVKEYNDMLTLKEKLFTNKKKK